MTIFPLKQSTRDSDYTSISIACTAIRSGMRQTVTKKFSSRRSSLPFAGDFETMDIAFTLEKTKREILQHRLFLEPGCIITDAYGTYRCTTITYTNPPMHPVLHAKYIGPITPSA